MSDERPEDQPEIHPEVQPEKYAEDRPNEGYTTSRRAMLALTALGAAGMVFAPTAVMAAETAVDDTSGEDTGAIGADDGALAACGATVYPHSEIWGAPTYYEPTGTAASFRYNATFYNRLETWLAFWYANTPVSWLTPLRVWSYGCYVNRNDGCVSMHNYGRAFDISRIYATVNGSLSRVFYARYDLWRTLTGSALTTTRKRYWATAASIHYHFKYVLTYAYNSAHWNHIHMDNQVSGGGNSTFSTGSRSQIVHVQAVCTYIWGYATTIDGIWGPQTDGNSRRVLSRIGRSGGLTTSQTNWLEFNRTSTRFGTGRQAY